MDLQARIAAALTDLDDLLAHGVSIEAALEVAAVENGVSLEALAARASRIVTLDERRRQAIEKAASIKEAAAREKAEAAGSLFAAAHFAEKKVRPSGVNPIVEKQKPDVDRLTREHDRPEVESVREDWRKPRQLRLDF